MSAVSAAWDACFSGDVVNMIIPSGFVVNGDTEEFSILDL